MFEHYFLNAFLFNIYPYVLWVKCSPVVILQFLQNQFRVGTFYLTRIMILLSCVPQFETCVTCCANKRARNTQDGRTQYVVFQHVKKKDTKCAVCTLNLYKKEQT